MTALNLSASDRHFFSESVIPMATAENADKIIRALKRAGINFVASLPDASLAPLVQGFDKDNDIIHVPLSREEEGVGVCMGANFAGKRCALMMQNAGLLNSCNALTTTARQIEVPMLLLVLYAGALNDMAFPDAGYRNRTGAGGSWHSALRPRRSQ